MIENQDKLTYRDAGVDIDAGNRLIDRIKPAAATTRRPGVMDALGGFGALFDLKAAGFADPVLVSATDGVGTKLKIAIESNVHDTVGIDLVAMCVNDLIVQGAEPLFFLDYFASGVLSVDHAATVIEGVAEGCRQAGAALIGGETAELPGLYASGDYDLAGFAVGAVDREKILPQRNIKPGDRLLGLASNGVHSNGFSLVRRIVEKTGLGWDAPAPFQDDSTLDGPILAGPTLAGALLAPTRIYVRSCLKAIRDNGSVKALAHITGGGLTENIPRILPDHLAAKIDLSAWSVPPVFRWLAANGPVEQAEMLRTFNCGIGMVLVCGEESADAIAHILADEGETVFRLGEITIDSGDAVEYSGQSDLC